MPRVCVLPDGLVNRIAAGEVVERPASVVKELVENSLDADARRLRVELQAGGRSLVRVTDDGCGMEEDDALLALERHATSKISDVDDLSSIATLGFRGEALPSIAAVSRFTMVTAADAEQGGLRVVVEGGRILGVEPVARARGTTVEVRDLFFNLPARRKFMYSPETELRHAQEVVWAIALARPEVAISLCHGPRTLLDLPEAVDAAARLLQLLTGRATGPIRRFAASGGGVEVSGMLALGRGSGRADLTFLVNGRPVRDRTLVGAALRVLRAAGSGFGGARLVVQVTLPHDQLDVNVHPAKAEVRFARPGAVFAVVERALREGVRSAQGRVEVRRIEQVGGSLDAAQDLAPETRGQPPAAGLFDDQAAASGDAAPSAARIGYTEPSFLPSAVADAGPAERPAFGRIIGQYRASFILLEDPSGLVIVDQHVAHERVLFDQILRRLEGENRPAQRLLEPLLLEVGEALCAALPRVQGLLERVGIEAEPFGPDAVRVLALPMELGSAAAAEAVAEILQRATAVDEVAEGTVRELAHEVAASLACRAAVKVNHPLGAEEQSALIRDLAESDNPFRCPHGRPIVLRLSHDEMERRLGRR